MVGCEREGDEGLEVRWSVRLRMPWCLAVFREERVWFVFHYRYDR
jgi:hypothetical protein